MIKNLFFHPSTRHSSMHVLERSISIEIGETKMNIVLIVTAASLGLISTFSPCLFPILPSYVAYLTSARQSPLKGLLSGLLVTLGIMTVFIILGIIFNSIIGLLSVYYTHLRFLQGLLLVILGGLLTADVMVKIPFLSKISSETNDALDKIKNPWVLAYAIGFFFSILAAPCAIVAFITLFVLIASETVLTTIIAMIVFSLAAGIPFLLIGFLLPLFKENAMTWDYHRLQSIAPRIAGIFIILVGLYLMIDSNLLIPSFF